MGRLKYCVKKKARPQTSIKKKAIFYVNACFHLNLYAIFSFEEQAKHSWKDTYDRKNDVVLHGVKMSYEF